MRIAVLTLTRDRLDYTKHCFGLLEKLSGCSYDHYVLDQGSQDETVEWLKGRVHWIEALDTNIGVCRGVNRLLDKALPENYDVYVRFDNDCELIQPDTLRAVCGLALEHDAILAPRVLGLLQPPGTIQVTQIGDCVIDETGILGGIFMAIPAAMFTERGFRFDESSPIYGGDEQIVPWWRGRGGLAGYVRGFSVNHYETTEGQRVRYPEYFVRKDREFYGG